MAIELVGLGLVILFIGSNLLSYMVGRRHERQNRNNLVSEAFDDIAGRR